MTLSENLYQKINQARARVYQVGDPTPMDVMAIQDRQVWVKREDLGPIKAYKWRGAYNAVSSLDEKTRSRGIVAASAGNHAQGIALAASRLGCGATIFMPKPTPQVKRDAVKLHGGELVEIVLLGDSFDEAQDAAIAFAKENEASFIPPYDSLDVMAGQGTLADEIVLHPDGPFDRVYVAIGGGGIAAAVATWIKSFWPDCQVIGVEGVHQASMATAMQTGSPTELGYVDLFCDGTAVKKVGELTYELCREHLDGLITVTNEEVSAAIKAHWDALRVVPEPSGAMSLAGFLKEEAEGVVPPESKCVTILCGANMDFAQLAQISRQAGLAGREEQSWRFSVPDERGSLVSLLESLPAGVNITELQYGFTDSDQQYPVLRLEAADDAADTFERLLHVNNPEAVDVSNTPQTRHRVIPFSPKLFQAPWFVEVEFRERAGALLSFMREVSDFASLCYFNYSYSGERVGRALLGLDFSNAEQREAAIKELRNLDGKSLRNLREIPDFP